MEDEKALEALARVGIVQTKKGQHMACPRCGEDKMYERIHTNAYSRHAECYICPDCGTDEALRDYGGSPLPPSKWKFITDILDVLIGKEKAK